MARPKEALISRRRSLEVALKIIDEEGLAALSIRRLAVELGVNGASLYHHFENKDAIVRGAAALALDNVRTPLNDSSTWREWLPENARRLRLALLKHPEVIPVIVGNRAVAVGTKNLDTSAERLMREGVPSAAVIPLLESLELLAIGSALHQTQEESQSNSFLLEANKYPSLARALNDRGLEPEEIFEIATQSVVEAIDEAIRIRQARWLPVDDKVADDTQ